MNNWLLKQKMLAGVLQPAIVAFAVAIALAAAGCSSQKEQPIAQSAPDKEAPAEIQTAPAQPVKLTVEQELAKYCRVCVVDKGEKIEEFFPSRLDTKHDGKTYKLCSDACKKKFDADPKRYALK